MEADYYQILQIARNASDKEIKRAYHRLARERHPDKASSPDQVQRMQEEFALISTAYNVLKDKDKRAEYDLRLRKELEKRAAGNGVSTTVPAAASTTVAPDGTGARARAASVRERAAIAQRAFAKGMQLYTAGDYLRACDFFEAAVQNNEDEAVYQSKLGISLMRSRKGFNRAVSAIQRAIELDPYNIEHRLALGECYELVGSTSLAVKTYQEILKWDATNAKALDRLAALNAGLKGSVLTRVLNILKRR